MTTAPASIVVARHALTLAARERTVHLLAALLLALVLLSARLGWSATSTVDAIYADATAGLAAAGRAVPPNPVDAASPLALMRNLSIYIALIGALSAIVMGHRLVAVDRWAGVVPLVGSRALTRRAWATGKLLALASEVGLLVVLAWTIAATTLALLPVAAPSAEQWGRLLLFFGASWSYLCLFGSLAVGASARARSESSGLLAPVSAWLGATFILPTLTSNVNPTAALNPVSALAPRPDTAFFDWTTSLLGPISVTDGYKLVAAHLLDALPASAPGWALPATSLVGGFALCAAFAWTSLVRMDMSGGPVDV